ncbi:homoserine dehydrogenase [Candidatus Bathyarchaeota archaeon]|nr:homoserine dehydrogenase [Candidatus Bathyarchaeota archaeon]
MVEEIKVSFIGAGTVGRSLIAMLDGKHHLIERKYGIRFKLVAIFEYDGALIDEQGVDIQSLVYGKNMRRMDAWKPGITALETIESLDFDLLVEMTPTNVKTGEPAFSHIKKALISGKDVVSSNKGPFLLHFDEIMGLSRQTGKKVRFEATVGSCIPVLQSWRTSMHGNKVLRIEAILNGTSNYILTRMANEKLDFSIALKEAQERGYAEADPTLDIDGHDAAGKLVILANALMGMARTNKDVKVEGITHINPEAINMASKEGFVIKHLGIADEDGTLEVKPFLIPKNSPLGAGITGTLNAVRIVTDLSGEIILVGHGAGGDEAASAILSDMIDIYLKS